LIAACQQRKAPAVAAEPITVQQTTKKRQKLLTHDTARKEVPILYHNIKDFADQAGEMTKTYTVKPLSFAAQMKAIHDAGYHSILPNQLYNYLAWRSLPSKPIMITFDDTRGEQFSIGASEMKNMVLKAFSL
jgi:hypothetical protein